MSEEELLKEANKLWVPPHMLPVFAIELILEDRARSGQPDNELERLRIRMLKEELLWRSICAQKPSPRV